MQTYKFYCFRNDFFTGAKKTALQNHYKEEIKQLAKEAIKQCLQKGFAPNSFVRARLRMYLRVALETSSTDAARAEVVKAIKHPQPVREADISLNDE